MELHETTVDQTTVFQGKILTLHHDTVRLPDGRLSHREVVEHGGGVCVAAVTDEGDVLLVEQFRYPYGEVVTELPAGKREPGEDPQVTALRELKEETGFTADRLIPLGCCYPSPGYTSEIIWLYAATGLHAGESTPDEGEFLEVKRLPLEKAVEQVMKGAIPDAKSQILLLKLWTLCSGKELL